MSRPSLESTSITLPPTGWQGIAYLSLTVTEYVSDPPSAVLVVHLNAAIDASFTVDDVEVTGGRRITDLDYTVTTPTAGDTTLTITFPTIGDRSTYTVEIKAGGGSPLHPFFARSDFSFTIDCEGGDCRPSEEEAEAELPPRPALDLLTKDFVGFVHLLAERAQVVDPAWSDHAPASLERVLIDLLAHAGDMISYHQDRVANEAFVATARERWSLTQHALLLGVDTFPGQAATTILGFTVGADGYVPAGLQVRMAGTTDEAHVVFHCLARTRVYSARNPDALLLAGWPGITDATIPAGSTSLRLWGHDLPLSAGDRIAIVQGGSSQVLTITTVEELAEPGWTDDPAAGGTPSTSDQDITEVTFEDALDFELAPWGDTDFAIHGNLVEARHGAEHVAWVSPTTTVPRTQAIVELSPDASTVVAVERTGGTAYHLRQLRIPEGPVMWASPGGGAAPEPLVELRVDGEDWTRVAHLHNSQSYDEHYVADIDNDGGLWLRFGDGAYGREIEVEDAVDPSAWTVDAPAIEGSQGDTSVPLRLRWWVGEPLAGNVGIDTLTVVVPPAAGSTEGVDLDGLGAVTVTNVIPATGGRAPDALDAIRERIPESITHAPLERAVTLADYAAVAEDVDGVGRAVARALRTPFNTVLVLVDPESEDELSEELRAEVQAYVDARRMAGREVIVRQADFVPLDVELGICVDPGYQRHEVRERVYAALRPGTDENPGWFHPDRLSFGEDVDLGSLLAFVMGIDGVRSVNALRFRRLLEVEDPDDLVDHRITLSETEVARMDGDDDYPENGRLVVLAVGLDEVDEDSWPGIDAEASP